MTRAAHWLSLLVALLVLVWVDRHQWFGADQWAFLLKRGLVTRGGSQGLLQPHNEHWVTIPILGYRLLFIVFGVKTYLPYALVTILVDLAIAHLLWRLLLRVGVSPWLSVVACGLFAILGVAWQDLTSAFQWAFIGPLVLGLAALLVTPTRGALGRRDVLVVALLTVNLLVSGLSLVMVIIVCITVALRRGIRAAIAVGIVPALLYLLWYLAYGRHAVAAGTLPLRTALQVAPNFTWQGLLSAVDGAIGLAAIGPVVLALLAIWEVRRARPDQEPWPLVLSTSSGAVIFLFLTALRRAGLGVGEAQSSRYTYVVVALLLPAAALATDQLLRRSNLRVAAVVALGLALLLVQLSTLTSSANAAAVVAQEEKHRTLGAAVLARQHAKVVSPYVIPATSPQLTFAGVRELVRDGRLPGNVAATAVDVLTAREYLQTSLDTKALVSTTSPPTVTAVTGAQLSARPGCADVLAESSTPAITLRLHGPAALTIRSGYGGALGLTLRADGATGRSRVFVLPAQKDRILSVIGVPADLILTPPATGTTTVCGLAP